MAMAVLDGLEHDVTGRRAERSGGKADCEIQSDRAATFMQGSD